MTDESARIAALEAQVALLTQVVAREYTLGASSPLADETRALAEVQAALAPLQILLDDESVNDILINGVDSIYVERAGKLERTPLRLESRSQIGTIAQAIAAQNGRCINAAQPLLDARLPDGSRVNVVMSPLAVDGTAISIRKFSRRSVTLDDMCKTGNISPGLAEFLKVIARCKMNIIIAGGTGSGKTTLLNAISQHIDPLDRIVTIEDTAELKLQQPHVVRMETRPVSGGKHGEEISVRDLMRNALRMRPDRIIVGEVRGAEAFDMLQAMNTGHEGSLATIHANHPRDALARLENMVTMANLNLPTQAMRSQIASAVHLVVQVSRMRDGIRRVAFVSEVVGMETDIITMQELFAFHTRGEGTDGKLAGEFKWSGIMPRFLRRAAYYGEAERLANALGAKLPKL